MKHLLLLHGAIGAKDQFEPLAEKLKNDFTVHTLNFSGHGRLSLPGTFSIEVFADDVLNYLEDNQIDSIDIFGYSMGGYVALFIARRFPDKINRIFTLATKFEWTPDISARETKMLDAEKIAEKIPAFAKQLEHRHGLSDWKQVLSKTADMMRDLGADNPLKDTDYKSIQHQILIAIGDKDAMVTLEETVAVYRELPMANLLVLPNTQHPLEKVEVNRLAFEIGLFFK
jgi:esterase/lipase